MFFFNWCTLGTPGITRFVVFYLFILEMYLEDLAEILWGGKKKKKNFVFPEKSNLEKCFLIEIWITFFHVRLTGNSNSNNLLIVYVKVPPHTQTNICRSVSVSFFIVHYQTNNLNINLKIKFKALSFKTFEEANKNEFDKNLIFHFVRVWRLSYLRHQGYTGY